MSESSARRATLHIVEGENSSVQGSLLPGVSHACKHNVSTMCKHAEPPFVFAQTVFILWYTCRGTNKWPWRLPLTPHTSQRWHWAIRSRLLGRLLCTTSPCRSLLSRAVVRPTSPAEPRAARRDLRGHYIAKSMEITPCCWCRSSSRRRGPRATPEWPSRARRRHRRRRLCSPSPTPSVLMAKPRRSRAE